MRKTASSGGGLITRLSEGTIVKILETNVNSEWYHVRTANGRTGYVNRMYVNIDASLPSYQAELHGNHRKCGNGCQRAHRTFRTRKKTRQGGKGADVIR